jgi:oxygen-independent coproporphyrinogen III oxidase
VLQSLNRHQTTTQVLGLLDKAAPFFDNLSIDLILGLPGISGDEWKTLLDTVMQWPIKHISVYFLTVHENTPLYFKVQANQITIPADEEIVALYLYTCDMLAQHGFEQYELSNFAKPGYASRHNTAYWNRNPYKGFGIGACSFDGATRFQNEKNIMKYMTLCEEHSSPVVFFEQLTHMQAWLEKLMLGLRRPVGVEVALLQHDSIPDGALRRMEVLQRLIGEGYIEYQGSRVRLTRQGLAVENEILVRLAQEVT